MAVRMGLVLNLGWPGASRMTEWDKQCRARLSPSSRLACAALTQRLRGRSWTRNVVPPFWEAEPEEVPRRMNEMGARARRGEGVRIFDAHR